MPNIFRFLTFVGRKNRRQYFAISIFAAFATLTLQGSSAQESTDDESFFMFNALWFNEDGGAEKYGEYLQAATPFVAKHGGKSNDSFVPEQSLIGEFDADLVFMIEWPNFAAFTGLIQDPGYQEISHLREEAITNSLLVRFRKL
ncbi:MAG: DUF1330 domain-containing protein [Gammaproteobacteria bacterium]|jgi:uncharacterized protein (DUF1330 family)|nr:DUF1330 domain-containing protein [Gammaproteobacteria bacterium]